MCLAVPMKIIEMQADGLAVAELSGSQTHVDLSLVNNVAIGDYVIVHAGFAIEKLNEEQAREQVALFAELAAVWKTSQQSPS